MEAADRSLWTAARPVGGLDEGPRLKAPGPRYRRSDDHRKAEGVRAAFQHGALRAAHRCHGDHGILLCRRFAAGSSRALHAGASFAPGA